MKWLKTYSNQTVYEASQERLAYLFKEFEHVLVAFSGGKDSGMLLHMAYDYATKRGLKNKLAYYFLDYEAQYQATMQYVQSVFDDLADVQRFWLALPNSVPTSTSATQGLWVPWEKDKRDIWVRPMPVADYVVNEDNVPWDYTPGTRDYQVQDDFTAWYADAYGKTAAAIGIRADESLDRFRAIKGQHKVNGYKDTNYVIKRSPNLANAYPIYDWQTRDVWIANAKKAWPYNKIYDLYYQAGLPIDQMRVASPFISQGIATLRLYQVIEPDTWAKMVGRVNGANFAGIYGGTTAMGWKSITLPKGMTWRSYLAFLLKTLPKDARENYEHIFETSISFWRDKGGVLDDQTIKELQDAGIHVKVGKKTNYRTTKKPVTFDDYPDDAPVTNFRVVPSYKRMCITIMKNDHTAKYMGFAQTKAQVEKRKRAIEKYSSIL
ncbi:MAG: DUF3440 domain-containing protein [Lactobacillus sp.]|nr:DUF3440 domain-containing protein [Lactobacillus sp.]MCI2032046.1 DUF3440 domain-containing protein [Lactobacillus sp.]